jgi:predicted nucleic acid-binding protein
MPSEGASRAPVPRLYWDSCVFLALIEGDDSARLPIIQSLLMDAEQKKIEIFSSHLTVAEVAYGKAEKDGRALNASTEEKINKLWHPDSPFKLVEVHFLNSFDAKSIVRDGITNSRAIKPHDAIHLATAKRLGISEFHTYDELLWRWDSVLGFRVIAPRCDQLMLSTVMPNSAPAIPPTSPEGN